MSRFHVTLIDAKGNHAAVVQHSALTYILQTRSSTPLELFPKLLILNDPHHYDLRMNPTSRTAKSLLATQATFSTTREALK